MRTYSEPCCVNQLERDTCVFLIPKVDVLDRLVSATCRKVIDEDRCLVKAGSGRLSLVDLIAIRTLDRMPNSGYSPAPAIDPLLPHARLPPAATL